jgi:hypothetical protein
MPVGDVTVIWLVSGEGEIPHSTLLVIDKWCVRQGQFLVRRDLSETQVGSLTSSPGAGVAWFLPLSPCLCALSPVEDDLPGFPCPQLWATWHGAGGSPRVRSVPIPHHHECR